MVLILTQKLRSSMLLGGCFATTPTAMYLSYVLVPRASEALRFISSAHKSRHQDSAASTCTYNLLIVVGGGCEATTPTTTSSLIHFNKINRLALHLNVVVESYAY